MAAKYLREDVLAMKAYTPGEQVNNCTKLNTNECAWGPSASVLKAITEATPDHLRLYPSPMCDRLRAAAAEVFHVNADQILVGNGSDDCLTVIMRSFVLPGSRVACPWPTYSLYDTLATIQGVEITHVDWLSDVDPTLEGAAAIGGVPGWHMPVDALAKSGARVVFVATPNNPSATLVPLAALEALADRLDGILVVDEAYIDYACGGDGMAASAIPKLTAHPNVLVLRTFSKSYSMAGARLGLMFGDPQLIMHMGKVKDSYNVNALTQIAGEAALRDRDHFRWLVNSTLEQRQVLEAFFGRINWVWPKSDANFMLVDTGSVALASAIYEGLKASGILVRYWGSRPDLASKLRVTVGSEDSNNRFMDLVQRLLNELPEARTTAS